MALHGKTSFESRNFRKSHSVSARVNALVGENPYLLPNQSLNRINMVAFKILGGIKSLSIPAWRADKTGQRILQTRTPLLWWSKCFQRRRLCKEGKRKGGIVLRQKHPEISMRKFGWRKQPGLETPRAKTPKVFTLVWVKCFPSAHSQV